ncbi:unnamed protein product [Prorocentrum cordatum]|uniref:C2 domain-containing protein n=1 Tax=Prorocentrum cordatum TaxID=2364126 RepID=A0ABN9SVE1_9DINO|nr:unnamed protein product [Polarella glacialis]
MNAMPSCLAVATSLHSTGDCAGAGVPPQLSCRRARLPLVVSSPSQAMVQERSGAQRTGQSVIARCSLPAVAAASAVLLPVGILAYALARVRRRLARQERRNQELLIDCQQAEALSDDLQQRLDMVERAGAAALDVLAKVVPQAPLRKRNGLSLSDEDDAALRKAQEALETVLRSPPQEAPSLAPPGDGTAIKTGLRTYIYRSTSGVGAVNAFLQEVWPGATEFIQHTVEDVIQEAFSSLPLPLNKLGFERLEFGSRSLKLEDVQVRGGNMKGDAGHDVEIAARMRWNTDIWRRGAKGLGRFGLSHLDLDGRLVVYLKRQVPEPPFFEGCRVFLVDRPVIKFELRGRVLAMPVPALQYLLEQLVRREIARQLVLPMAVFPLATTEKWEGGLWYNVSRIVPDGLLFVRVLRASGLPSSDWLTESDPYVRLSLGVAEWRSAVCGEGGSCPEWADEEGLFLVHDVPEQTLQVEVFDADFAKQDDLLATALLRARELVQAGPGEQSVRLERAPLFKSTTSPCISASPRAGSPSSPAARARAGARGPPRSSSRAGRRGAGRGLPPRRGRAARGADGGADAGDEGGPGRCRRRGAVAGGARAALAARAGASAPHPWPRVRGRREVGRAVLPPPRAGAEAAAPASLQLAGAQVAERGALVRAGGAAVGLTAGAPALGAERRGAGLGAHGLGRSPAPCLASLGRAHCSRRGPRPTEGLDHPAVFACARGEFDASSTRTRRGFGLDPTRSTRIRRDFHAAAGVTGQR